MVNYGVTETGFNKKTFANVIDDLHANAKRMFGQDVDLTPGSPIKIAIDMFAAEFTGMWAELEKCYNAGFINTAMEKSLDNLAQLVGVERAAGQKAVGEVTFLRTTVLPDGSARMIPAGTIVKTSSIFPIRFKTTQSVYFEPTVTDEAHVLAEDTDKVSCVNIIGEIVSIVDSDLNDHTSSSTFIEREITLPSVLDNGTTVTVTYKPLSVTAGIEALVAGTDGNVSASVINVADTEIDFIHTINNESGIDTGVDMESDSMLRARVVGAAQSVGKATDIALTHFLKQVTGVTNVMIEDPLNIAAQDTPTANGTTSFYVTNMPVVSITSVEGSVGGTYTVDSFNIDTGEVILTEATSNGETLVVDYVYSHIGKIKIYVEGGAVGDENTEDTIVYAIENTRAAGIQAVGYGTSDENANGSDTAPFSWFYRPENAAIDVSVTVYFDGESILTNAAKDTIVGEIQAEVTEHINSLAISEKLYKNKLLQIAIAKNPDIVDAQLTAWELNNVSQVTTLSYIQGGSTEIPIAQTITITQESEV